MTLSAMIRKRETARPATTLSVNAETVSLPPAPKQRIVEPSRWWRIHYIEGDTVELACYPDASRTVILEHYPDATLVEPCSPTIQPPFAPMTPTEEMAVRAWLSRIEEEDPLVIEEVVSHCQANIADRTFFLEQANR